MHQTPHPTTARSWQIGNATDSAEPNTTWLPHAAAAHIDAGEGSVTGHGSSSTVGSSRDDNGLAGEDLQDETRGPAGEVAGNAAAGFAQNDARDGGEEDGRSLDNGTTGDSAHDAGDETRGGTHVASLKVMGGGTGGGSGSADRATRGGSSGVVGGGADSADGATRGDACGGSGTCGGSSGGVGGGIDDGSAHDFGGEAWSASLGVGGGTDGGSGGTGSGATRSDTGVLVGGVRDGGPDVMGGRIDGSSGSTGDTTHNGAESHGGSLHVMDAGAGPSATSRDTGADSATLGSPSVRGRAGTGAAVVLAAVAAVLVGASVPVTGLLDAYPVLSGQAIRYGIGAVLLLGWLLGTRKPVPLPTARDLVGLSVMVGAGMLGFNAAVLIGQRYATPGFIAAMLGASPLLLAVVAPLLRRRRPSPFAIGGAGLVGLGVVVLSGGGSWHGPGLVLALLVVLCEVLFTLGGVGVVARLGAAQASMWSCALAAAGGAVLSTAAHGAAAWPLPTPTEAVAMGVLGSLVTAVAFGFWYSGVARLGADRVGVLIGVMPVAGLGASVLLGRQPLTAVALGGAAVVAVGCALGMRRAVSRRAPSAARPVPRRAGRA